MHGEHDKSKPIDLVEEFRASSIRAVTIDRETKDFIFISFFIQGYNMKWYKCEGAFVRKAEIKAMS